MHVFLVLNKYMVAITETKSSYVFLKYNFKQNLLLCKKVNKHSYE